MSIWRWLERVPGFNDRVDRGKAELDRGERSELESGGLVAGCAKCGGIDTSVRWDANFYDCLYLQQGRRDWPRDGGEHLHYQCRTCGFTWAGAL